MLQPDWINLCSEWINKWSKQASKKGGKQGMRLLVKKYFVKIFYLAVPKHQWKRSSAKCRMTKRFSGSQYEVNLTKDSNVIHKFQNRPVYVSRKARWKLCNFSRKGLKNQTVNSLISKQQGKKQVTVFFGNQETTIEKESSNEISWSS